MFSVCTCIYYNVVKEQIQFIYCVIKSPALSIGVVKWHTVWVWLIQVDVITLPSLWYIGMKQHLLFMVYRYNTQYQHLLFMVYMYNTQYQHLLFMVYMFDINTCLVCMWYHLNLHVDFTCRYDIIILCCVLFIGVISPVLQYLVKGISSSKSCS